MKICIIANGYPNSREPQWGCFERDQAIAFHKMGHEVSVLYIDGRYRRYWRKIGFSCFRDEGLSVYGMFLMPKQWLRRINYKVNFRLSVWMMEKVYQRYEKMEGRPDVIYAHYLFNIALATFIRKKHNILFVGIEHWSELTKETLKPMVQYYGNVGYFGVDKLLSVSKSLQTQIMRHFGIDSTVVYDMLGPEFVSVPVSKEKKRDFCFIAVGSLVPVKDYEMLIKAFSRSNLSLERCTLSIVGDGTERQRLEQLIEELKLKDNVFLLGRKTKNEIISLLSESHVYVLSSKSETFGVACIEALSQGLPVIATKCGGPEDFINKSNGVLIPTNDISSMAVAMKKMYSDYKKYDTMAIAEECRNRFSPMVIARQLTDIFDEVINQKK